MKTYKNLFSRIVSFDNLLLAAHKARRGKSNRPDVMRFFLDLEENLLKLQRGLCTLAYRPGPYRRFYIFDPKKRMISAAAFVDRVVHHALCNVIEPIFEATFIHDSYANRLGKGTHAAIRRFQFFQRKSRFVLKADIRKYFPSIDHQILKAALRGKIADQQTLWLIDLIIDSSNPQEPVADHFPGDDLFTPITRRKGLPIGNQTSQFFANVYLNPLDHFVKEQLRVHGYVRYVDDFALFSDDRRKLWLDAGEIERYLTSLRLKLNRKRTQVTPAAVGTPFLGQRVYPTHRLLAQSNVRRFCRRLSAMPAKLEAGLMTEEEIRHRVKSWEGHARQADTWRLRMGLARRFSDHMRD